MTTKNHTTKGRTNEESLARLPKWAAERIRNLENSLESTQTELQQHRSEEPTRLGLGFHHDIAKCGEPKQWLPDDEHVTFYFPDRFRERDTFIQFRMVRGRIRVCSSDGPLEINPEASNVVSLAVSERR